MANIDKAFTVDKLSLDDIVLITTGADDPSTGAGYEAPVGSMYLRSVNGEIYIKSDTNDTDWVKTGPLPIPVNIVGNLASTGILVGGRLSINVDPTLVDITAGVGIIVDNHTDPLNPTAVMISWPTTTGITLDNISTEVVTYFAIDSLSAVIQSPTSFDNTAHKNNIVIGVANHSTNTVVQAVRNAPDPAFDATARLADLARAIGTINVSGNIFSPNGANLSLNKNAGKTYRLGTNFHTNKKDPDVTVNPPLAPATFRYSYRDGAGGFIVSAPVTNVDPTMWDDGSGTLQAVPNGRFSVQHVHFFGGAEEVRIEYGQTTYSNLAAAASVVPAVDHNHNPIFEAEGTVRAYIIMAAATTDLTNPDDVLFIEGAKLAGGVSGATSGSTTTLQQAYLNSTEPEIVTTTGGGALTIREGIGVAGNILEGYNSSGNLQFSVSALGNVTVVGTVDGRDISVDGSTLDTLGTEVNNIETSLGSMISATGSWVGFTGTNNLDLATSTTQALTILDSQSAVPSFQTIVIPAGGPIVADSNTDTLTLTQSDGITITGTAGTDTINIAPANDLAAIEALATSGFATRTAADTWVIRTLTAPAAGFTITNPAGTAGNPTFALSDDLDGLEGLATTGVAVRTGTSTWTTRTITAGTGISITDGAGVTGNPTITNSAPNVDQNIFQTIAVAGQSDIVADSTADTLTIVGGTGIAVTTNATTDTVTFTATNTALSRHNGAISQTFGATPTALLFNTNVRTDADFTYNAGTVTFNTAGTYKVSFEASYASTSNPVSTGETVVYKNGSPVTGSTAYSNHASFDSGKQTTSSTTIVSFAVNDTLQIVGTRISGSGSLVSQVNGCRLNITRLT